MSITLRQLLSETEIASINRKYKCIDLNKQLKEVTLVELYDIAIDILKKDLKREMFAPAQLLVELSQRAYDRGINILD